MAKQKGKSGLKQNLENLLEALGNVFNPRLSQPVVVRREPALRRKRK
jgi:hypothetical protein